MRLTDYEIQRLCKWEGTRWARETYEAHNRVKIKDTTWNGVHDFRNKRPTVTVAPVRTEETIETEPGEISDNDIESEGEDEDMRDSDDGDELSEEESEEELQRSVGVDLNQRLLIATEARARGEEATIDADWEQWLKEAAESMLEEFFCPIEIGFGSQDLLRKRYTDSEFIQGGDLPEFSRMLNRTSTQAAPSQTSVYWGREIPEYLSEDSATLRARLPQLPQYFSPVEANSAVATAVAVPPPAHPAGATL